MDIYRSLEVSQPRICLSFPHNRASKTGETSDESLVDVLLSRLSLINPYAFHLAKVVWAVFGTLTWEREAVTTATAAAEAIRRKDFWWLIRSTCGRVRLRHKKLAIYRKTEWGPSRRGHCNFLIAQQGTEKVAPAELSEALQDTWTRNRKGRALIEPFDSHRHIEGVDYQSKPELDMSGNEIWFPEEFSPALQRIFQENAAVK